MAHLDNWAVVAAGEFDPYKSPEAQDRALCGTVTGHPTLPDFALIKTSRIVSVDSGAETVHTQNTVYTLGLPDAGYEQAFPNARERLFNRAPERSEASAPGGAYV